MPDFGKWGLNDCGRWAGLVRAGWDTNRTRMICFRMHFPQAPKTKKPYISLIHKVSFFLLPFLSKASGAENEIVCAIESRLRLIDCRIIDMHLVAIFCNSAI